MLSTPPASHKNQLWISTIMAETIGSLTDKITIVELKRYHMREQTTRADASAEHRETCLRKLEVLDLQRDDLVEELNQLFREVLAGTAQLQVYRQFKMYNDPKYRMNQATGTAMKSDSPSTCTSRPDD
jgi:hypothetical protein